MKNCHCETEIIRDGSGQLSRYLKALDPTYTKIDGRSMEDLLVFAKKYAAQIRFYDIPESHIPGNTPPHKISWREFFRRDMSVIASSIAVTETHNFKKEYDQANEKLQYQTTPEIYAAMYAPIVGMMKKIDRWYTVAIPENPLYEDLKLAIDSDLKDQVQKMVAYEKGFTYVDPTVDLKIDLTGIENKEAWGLNDVIPPDPGIYTGTTQQDKILSASLYTENIFHAFYNFINKLIHDSDRYVLFALEQYPGHQPHMALFITFLQLFSRAQQQMNGLTSRLLDFYYKEVLHLEAKPSVPDKAHIVFELAKDITEYNLVEGTTLKGGPDNADVEQLYKTSEDLVINQAKVKELKTIFVETIEKGKSTSNVIIKTIYARPIANSADGFGEKFTGTDLKWPTFGKGWPEKKSPGNACELIESLNEIINRKDQAKIGFAIASPQLVLRGGKRLIRLKLNNSIAALFAKQEKLSAAYKENLFEIWFSGEKEWFKVDKVMSQADQSRFEKFFPVNMFNPVTDDIEASFYLEKESNTLVVYLPTSSTAVVAYDAKLHGLYSYSTIHPVMQVMLNPLIEIKAQDFKNLSATGMSLKVKIGSILPGPEQIREFTELIAANNLNLSAEEKKSLSNFQADGLTELVIQNEKDGLLDAGKPFDPFTAYPDKGKSFFIGSDEVFNKPLGQLAVFIKKTRDTNKNRIAFSSSTGVRSAEYEVSILENRRWIDLVSVLKSDFNQVLLKINMLNRLLNKEEANEPILIPHHHVRKPIEAVTEWKPGTEKGFLRFTNLISVNADNVNFLQASQNMAPELEIKEVSVSYESDLIIMEPGIDEFYHVYPFGNAETYIKDAASIRDNQRDNPINLNDINKIGEFLRTNPFSKADKLKDYLIIDAGNALVPQFTFTSPYDQYSTQSSSVRKGDSENKKKAVYKNGDQVAAQLILKAGDFTSKIKGSDNQYSGALQEEGMLLIGLENAKPLQMVSMLFQFAEGSAMDEDNDPPEIHWSYLTNNEWRPLKDDNIVSDDTFGFQTTGIIKVEIPEDATNNNTIVTSGLYWLCASVNSNSNRIPMLIDIVTQAVIAEFVDNKNDQSHFDDALTAGSISELEVAATEVSNVLQPFASFDGKHREIGKEFYTRVSERLRHKARAITPWDYEHLVLDRFPSIYKVKCITHTDPNCLCREPEKIEKGKVQSVQVSKCGFEKIELKFQPELTELADDVSKKTLTEVVEMLNKGKECKILLTGFSVKDNNFSREINEKRLAHLNDHFIKAGIEQNRITSKLSETGEQNAVIISEMSNAGDTIEVVPKENREEICCGPQIAPGHVLLVPISNLKNRNAVNPLQPKTSRRVLLAIESYLKERASTFVKIHAKNPVYEEVLVFFRVKFMEGKDKGFHLKKLNDDIVHFLTPWAFDDIAEVKFGQKIYASSIINFIEERAYVNFITDFLMVVCRTGCCKEFLEAEPDVKDEEDLLNKITGCDDMEILLQDDPDFIGDIIAKPSTSRSLLVSAPKHIIIPYQEPVIPSPCETRKLNLMTKSKATVKGKAELSTKPAVLIAKPKNTPSKTEKQPGKTESKAVPTPSVVTKPKVTKQKEVPGTPQVTTHKTQPSKTTRKNIASKKKK